MSLPRAIGQRLADDAFAAGWALARHTPESVSRRALELAADGMWARRGPGVRRLEANLARAIPGVGPSRLRALSRLAMRSYARYWHEVLVLPTWPRQRIHEAVVTSNESTLRAIYAQGNGAILVLPHMGNWDLAGAWACLNGLPISTIAERLRPESLFRRFVSYRERLGMEVVALSRKTSPLAAMRSALARGRVAALLADRDVAGGGVEVTLLGEPARLPGGAAVLSRVTRVPLVVVTPSYEGRLLRLLVSDPIEPVSGRAGVVAMTQRIADEVSDAIRRHPQDWHMLQPVFVSDLSP